MGRSERKVTQFLKITDYRRFDQDRKGLAAHLPLTV
jgi:hypothetical protein